MNELDEIMSDDSNVTSEIQQEQTIEGPVRDDHGRFAAKQDEPAAAEPLVIEHQAEAHQPGGVPVAALQAERDKARTARDEAEALRREIAELRGMVTANRQPAPQPQQEQQPVTIWDDPDAFLKSQLSPVQQQMQELREMMWESQAAQAHTTEKLEAAKAAATALAGTPAGQALHSEIMAGGNPFSNLVKWHERQTTLATVGNDPQAWLNAEIEKRMNDPNFLAQAMERARATATSSVNRNQPMTSIPPSLSRIPSGTNAAADNDASDGAIFSHAMR